MRPRLRSFLVPPPGNPRVRAGRAGRTRGHLVGLVLALLATACGREPDVRIAGLTLRLPDSERCRPAQPITEIVVEALGDFPPSDARTIDLLRPQAEPARIDRFPADTEIVTFRARAPGWTGLAARVLPSTDLRGPLLLLPEDRSCPLADPALTDLGGAAAPLPGGGLLLAGGLEGELGTRRLVRLGPGARLGEVLGGLEVRRTGHVLVPTDDAVLILGGALGATGPAHDTWARWDVAAGELRAGGTLATPRRELGATRLPDGRVLLVGGRVSAESAPLATAELLEPSSGAVAPTGELPNARLAPHVLTLDDGSVLVVGGTGAGGATPPQLTTWDASSGTFFDLPEASLGPAPTAVVGAVALPGARALVVMDAAEGRPPTLALVRASSTGLGTEWAVDALDAARLAELHALRAAALPDGRALLTGRDPSGEPIALRLDPGTGRFEALEAPRAATALVPLADGLVAELAESGTSLRRPALRTPLTSPPATLLPSDLALDAPGRWSVSATALTAEAEGARADLATLRFADLALELEVRDPGRGVEILLTRPGAPPVPVVVRGDEVGPALCTLERPDDAGMVRLVRRGASLTLSVGEGEEAPARSCTVDELEGRVGLAFRAPTGATLERIRVERLATE